jgi:glycosyltransferase involved in cell wall biosynthesis
MTRPLISIITPTFGRPAFLERLITYVRSQSYENWEWRILDDSPTPNHVLVDLEDPRIHYRHTKKRLSIGAKRNSLIQASLGEIVVHFDDDDFYGPQYIDVMLGAMLRNEVDFVRLSGFFVLSISLKALGYYRIFVKNGPAFSFNSQAIQHVQLGELNIPMIHLNYGWTYMYRKLVWERAPFHDINTFEDREFVLAAREQFKIRYFEDTTGICCHTVHTGSSSRCFPQFLIPLFMAKKLNPPFENYLKNTNELALSAKINRGNETNSTSGVEAH